MIRRILAVSLLVLPAVLPARAETDTPPPILTQRVIAELSLDDLFAKLKDNPTSPAGGRIEQEILRRFSHSGSPTADLLMSWAVEAMDAKNFPLALDVLDQIIVIKPDFAEAWNKRATVYLSDRRLFRFARRHPTDAGARAAPFRRAVGLRHDP